MPGQGVATKSGEIREKGASTKPLEGVEKSGEALMYVKIRGKNTDGAAEEGSERGARGRRGGHRVKKEEESCVASERERPRASGRSPR